jgi:glycosyltransferase involved in cell wall biosynthesis
LALADSEYNRRDLLAAGYAPTGVLPLAVPNTLAQVQPDTEVLNRFDDGVANLLFVGRLVPNKRQEDVIKAFYYLRQIRPRSRLFLVGSWQNTRRYYAWLQEFAGRLGLSEAVYFPGHVSTAALAAYYRLADLFVCMSEHEGFCVPLIESMHFGVPVVAYASTAVPGTLGGAGILVREKRYDVIAELLHLLISDRKLYRQVVERQYARVQAFQEPAVLQQFRDYLQEHFAALFQD